LPEVVLIELVRDTTKLPPEATTQPNEPEPPARETPTSDVLEVRNSYDVSLIGDDFNPDSNSPVQEATAEEVMSEI